MGTVERAGDDHTSEVESGEEEEMVGGDELAKHLMKRYELSHLGYHNYASIVLSLFAGNMDLNTHTKILILNLNL